jgi:hypothetical protein
MNAAYGWAFAKPVRKVFYNITITSISVAVALIIGTIELIGVLADQAKITTGPLAAIASIPLDYAGYGIVVLFFAAWLIAIAVWRFGRVEQRWSADLAPSRSGASVSTRPGGQRRLDQPPAGRGRPGQQPATEFLHPVAQAEQSAPGAGQARPFLG